MPASALSRAIRLPAGLSLCLSLLASPAMAQAVYKCVQGGKTSYQSTPCAAGTGDTVKLAAPPDPAEVAAARARAASDIRTAGAPIDTPRAGGDARDRAGRAQPAGRVFTRGGGDCTSLSARLQALYDKRAGGLASARQGNGVVGNSKADDAIARTQLDIVDVQRQMRAKGCPVAP